MSDTPPMTTAIAIEVDGAIARLTLDRPDKLNALNRAVLEELAAAGAWFDTQDDVKVVVVRGAGRAFTAGFDLDDTRWRELGAPERSAETGRAMADAVAGMRAITIASIQGHCIGGGVVLAAACDLRIAAAGATFRIPEIDLGIPLFWAGVPLLARQIGPAMTKELVLTGRTFDADEAHRIGLLNRLVPDDDLDATTDELAATLAAKPALVLRTTKVQVDEALPPIPADTPGAASDVEQMRAAFDDAESRASALAYVERALRRGR
jgi:enoyl-CoA hydratase/carnithine racemase